MSYKTPINKQHLKFKEKSNAGKSKTSKKDCQANRQETNGQEISSKKKVS